MVVHVQITIFIVIISSARKCSAAMPMACTVLVGVGKANSIKRDSGIEIIVCRCPASRYLYIT